MKKNLFSRSSVSFEQQQQISEQVRSLVRESWEGIKASKITMPNSLYNEHKKELKSEPKK